MRIELLVAAVFAVCSLAGMAATLWVRKRRAEREMERSLRAREDAFRHLRDCLMANGLGSSSRFANSWVSAHLEPPDLEQFQAAFEQVRAELQRDGDEILAQILARADSSKVFPRAVFSAKRLPRPAEKLPALAHVVEAIADAVLPARVNDEQLGDAIERRERYRHEGRHRWWVTVWFIAQVGWAFYAAITGKGGAAQKKSAE